MYLYQLYECAFGHQPIGDYPLSTKPISTTVLHLSSTECCQCDEWLSIHNSSC